MLKFTDCIDDEGYLDVSIYEHQCEDSIKNNKTCIDIMGWSSFNESSFRICLSVDDTKILIEKLKLEISKINQDGTR